MQTEMLKQRDWDQWNFNDCLALAYDISREQIETRKISTLFGFTPLRRSCTLYLKLNLSLQKMDQRVKNFQIITFERLETFSILLSSQMLRSSCCVNFSSNFMSRCLDVITWCKSIGSPAVVWNGKKLMYDLKYIFNTMYISH